jgi:hypothetical protein
MTFDLIAIPALATERLLREASGVPQEVAIGSEWALFGLFGALLVAKGCVCWRLAASSVDKP